MRRRELLSLTGRAVGRNASPTARHAAADVLQKTTADCREQIPAAMKSGK